MSNPISNKTTIRNKALDLLANREHTKLELQRKLNAKGFAVDEITQVVDELAQKNLQSDERFLEGYVNMRANCGFGPVRIKQELHERGISKELIGQSDIFVSIDWQDLIQKVCKKKFGFKLLDTPAEKAKQVRYLCYKGFDFDLIKRIHRLMQS